MELRAAAVWLLPPRPMGTGGTRRAAGDEHVGSAPKYQTSTIGGSQRFRRSSPAPGVDAPKN